MFAKLLLLAVVCVPLSCGFHLRGAVDLPSQLTPLYVERYSTDNELSREIRNLLAQATTGNLAESKGDAAAELVIITALKKRRILAVDNRGRARQYELEYRVTYSVSGKNINAGIDESVEHTRELHLKRDLYFDPDSVLAISHEQETLYEDMRKDAARLILQQLKAMGQPVSEK